MLETLTREESESNSFIALAETLGSISVATGDSELLDNLRSLKEVQLPGDPPETPGTFAGFQSSAPGPEDEPEEEFVSSGEGGS